MIFLGFYCLINSTGPRPVGATNNTGSSSASCTCPSEGIGGVCPIGCFCPADTGCPVPCSSGYFCNETGSFENCFITKMLVIYEL